MKKNGKSLSHQFFSMAPHCRVSTVTAYVEPTGTGGSSSTRARGNRPSLGRSQNHTSFQRVELVSSIPPRPRVCTVHFKRE